MIFYLALFLAYLFGVVALTMLILSLKRYEEEYIARRIVLVPISFIGQKILLLVIATARIIEGSPPPPTAIALLALTASIVPAAISLYLWGVFTGRWNGWVSRPPDKFFDKPDPLDSSSDSY